MILHGRRIISLVYYWMDVLEKKLCLIVLLAKSGGYLFLLKTLLLKFLYFQQSYREFLFFFISIMHLILGSLLSKEITLKYL